LRISSTGAHPGRREIRPDIGAPLAASRADELILDVGNPDVIGPLARVHFDRVAALVVCAIDQDAIGAGLWKSRSAIFSELPISPQHFPKVCFQRGASRRIRRTSICPTNSLIFAAYEVEKRADALKDFMYGDGAA
jgi:hypothetical protein